METSYPPELYARLHTGNPGDLAFYREQCRRATTILELGCGYGRVLEALADEKRQLVGLDKSPGLLALARQRLRNKVPAQIELVLGDMRRFAFNMRFDRILIPYSGIYCLLSSGDVRACLQRVAEHLNPDGRLVFDAYAADSFHRNCEAEEDDATDEAQEIATIVNEGVTYHVVEQSEWARDDQRLDVVYTHEPRQGGYVIATRLEHRYLLSEQIEPLLAEAGLEPVSLAGDYDGGRLDEDSDLIVVTARLS